MSEERDRRLGVSESILSTSIWPAELLTGISRSPAEVLRESVDELKEAGLYRAELSRKRRGENRPSGEPTSRIDLKFGRATRPLQTILTVEYPEEGYPATMFLGKDGQLRVQVSSEDEFKIELKRYLAANLRQLAA
jgi:hypothetical protein